MFKTSPPRAVLAIQAAMLTAFGIQWIVFGNSHSANFPFQQLRAIGHPFDPSRPMLLWGLLFLVVGLAELIGIVARNSVVAGAGAVAAAPLAIFYGVLNGLSSAQHTVLVNGHHAHDGTLTVLILMVGLALWCATSAVMLLGRKDTWRKT